MIVGQDQAGSARARRYVDGDCPHAWRQDGRRHPGIAALDDGGAVQRLAQHDLAARHGIAVARQRILAGCAFDDKARIQDRFRPLLPTEIGVDQDVAGIDIPGRHQNFFDAAHGNLGRRLSWLLLLLDRGKKTGRKECRQDRRPQRHHDQDDHYRSHEAPLSGLADLTQRQVHSSRAIHFAAIDPRKPLLPIFG